jgi:DNA-binding LytR/AlgR family response regulator
MVDVAQVEPVRNYLSRRIGKDKLHARSTLQQAEGAMRSQPMLRISRSCLININHVREVSRTLRGNFTWSSPVARPHRAAKATATNYAFILSD